MLRQLRRGIAVVLVYVMALHGVLAAVLPAVATTAAFDPTAVTCLHDAGLPDDGGPPTGATQTGCDHCVLRVAVAPPSSSGDVAWILAPAQTLQLTRVNAAPLPPQFTFDRTRLRGPPRTV